MNCGGGIRTHVTQLMRLGWNLSRPLRNNRNGETWTHNFWFPKPVDYQIVLHSVVATQTFMTRWLCRVFIVANAHLILLAMHFRFLTISVFSYRLQDSNLRLQFCRNCTLPTELNRYILTILTKSSNSANTCNQWIVSNGADEFRTHYLLLAKQTLSQLSYNPITTLTRFELVTSCVTGKRSDQLNYRAIN